MNNPKDKFAEDMLRLMQADKSIDAPDHAVRYAKNLFRTMSSQAQPSALRRFIATLTADLAPNVAAYGERSASGAAARQMLFTTGEHAIDLRISSVENGFDIRGQILGDGLINATATLESSGFTATCEVDANNGFQFSTLPTGEFGLTIRGSDSEIAVDKISL